MANAHARGVLKWTAGALGVAAGAYAGYVKDVINDYRTNRKRSLDDVERRIERHLKPFFGNRRMASITTADIREYIDSRQKETTIVRRAFTFTARDGTPRQVPEQRRTITGVSNAEINRELTALKRMFNLAIQAGKLLQKPHIPLLKEDNVRVGFFERDQFLAVLAHLPEPVRPAASFAYLTGWRIDSEVLSLEWRQVDFGAGEVKLDPGKTKNGEGRTFPMTRDLREVLEQQRTITSPPEVEQSRHQQHLREQRKRPMDARGHGTAFAADGRRRRQQIAPEGRSLEPDRRRPG